MGNRGVSTIADIIFLTLLITTACLLLGKVSEGEVSYPAGYSERFAQNTLLSFQQVPVKEFGGFSYTPSLPMIGTSERKLRGKTMAQLIAEGVLLNPEWKIDNLFVTTSRNSEFSRELENFIAKSLDKIVGRRFDYQFFARLRPISLSDNKVLRYQLFLQDLDNDSNYLCSESITLNVIIPRVWDYNEGSSSRNLYWGLDKLTKLLMPDFFHSEIEDILGSPVPLVKVGVLDLSLRLWSK